MTKLKKYRTSKNITQSQLEDKTGILRQAISRLESGDRSINDASLDIAARLATALDIHAEDLLEYDLIIEITDHGIHIAYDNKMPRSYLYTFDAAEEYLDEEFNDFDDMIKSIEIDITDDIHNRFPAASEEAQEKAINTIMNAFEDYMNTKW